MQDLISRQDAIDALSEMHCKSDEDGYVWIIRSDAWWRIETLPSAEPEIVRCKDCTNYDTDWIPETAPDRHYCLVMDGMMPKDGFCNYAERRIDE